MDTVFAQGPIEYPIFQASQVYFRNFVDRAWWHIKIQVRRLQIGLPKVESHCISYQMLIDFLWSVLGAVRET
jgi:hypothetical protein